MENKFKIDFIFKAIDDVTNTIRFLDAKVTGLFIAIGMILTGISTIEDSIYKIYSHFVIVKNHLISYVLFIIFVVYFALLVLCIHYGIKVLRPKENATDHIEINNIKDLVPKQLWYLENNKNDKVNITLEEFNSKIDKATEEDLIVAAEYELLKLSYIRNRKLKNINLSLMFYHFAILFIVVMVVFGYISYTYFY